MTRSYNSKLSLMLLLSVSTPLLFAHTEEQIAEDRANSSMMPKQVSFSGTLIEKMDGIAGILDAVAMSDCFTTIQDIVLLINGSHDTKSGQHIGIFEFEGKKYTLKDLVMIEMDLQKKGTSKTDPAYQKFNKMLKELINLFKVKATPLIQKTKSPVNRAMNEKLVNYWLIHSGRKNSIITSFGADKEFEAMEKCSAKEFFLFLNDLKCFLKDLMHSAPKACTLYKKECLKPENYAAFDAFLNH